MVNSEKEALKRARETYGRKNQILVSIEELNELACVLAKYPRYEDEAQAVFELKEKVIDEVADVTIILDHIKAIFQLTENEIDERVTKKVGRLKRWLEQSSSMTQTVKDREV